MREGEKTSNPLPRIRVSTEVFTGEGTPLDWVDPASPLVFQRNGVGLVGLGHAVVATFSGPDRFAEASAWWKELNQSATVVAPGSNDSGLVAFGTFSFSDHSATPSLLIVPEVTIRVGRQGSLITRVEIVGEKISPVEPRKFPVPQATRASFREGQMTEARFVDAVTTTLNQIHAGALSKAVIARDLVAQVGDNFTLIPALHSLAETYPDTHLFAIDGFFGASPETLCRVDNQAVTTTVLAGSIRHDNSSLGIEHARTELLSSDKNRSEHALAVSSVTDAFATRGIKVVANPSPEVVSLKTLMHLATRVQGQLPEGMSSLDVVEAVHPTAAVAGSPTDTALALIEQLEPADRGRYAGPVGWMDAEGNGEWALGLRCAQLEGNTLTAFAGAGIVADSDPNAELDETTLKFQPVVNALSAE